MSAPGQLTYGVNATRFYVGVGGTLAQFVDVVPGQIYTTVKYMNGGTLEILPALSGTSLLAAIVAGGTQSPTIAFQPSAGTTQSLAQLGNLAGTGYLMGTTEVFTFNGPARFYLSAQSATTLVCVTKHLSAGF